MKKLLQVAFLILMTQSALSAQNTGPNPTEKFNADNEYNPITIRNPVKLGDRTATLQFNGWLTPFGYRTGAELTTFVSALPVADDLPLDIVLRTGGNNIRNRLRVGNNGFVSINSDDLPAQFSVTQFSDQNPPNHNILLVRGGTSHNIKSFRLFTDASDVLNAILEGNMEINNGNLIVRDGKLGVGTNSPTYPLDIIGDARVQGANFMLGFNDGKEIGHMISQRALAHDSEDRLIINYGGDFEGGTFVQGERLTCKVLEITGGSDWAEPGEISSGELLGPGTVVCIDPIHPGQFMQSTSAYDKKVAGIISGAGGIKPGMLLKQEGKLDKGQPIALAGKVFVRATTANGKIEPGDLLTTSDFPGVAMKAISHRKSFGAVIGKAITRLEKGDGLVLVLVQLQ